VRSLVSNPRFVVVVVVLATVAALAVAIANRTADWQVDILGRARIVIDDREEGATTVRARDALARGGLIRTPPTAAAAIVSAGNLHLELGPDAELRLTAPPGRWFRRDVGASLYRGDLRILTAGEFAGAVLEVYTEGGMVRVTDALLAVERRGDSTRVSVAEGAVLAGPTADDLVPVQAGEDLILGGASGEATPTPLAAAMRDELTRFAARARGERPVE
jgi:hypothetical protein